MSDHQTRGEGHVGQKLSGPSVQLHDSRKGRQSKGVPVWRRGCAIMKKRGQSVKWSEGKIVGKKRIKQGRKMCVNKGMGW